MLELFLRTFITHQFQVDDNEGDTLICYDMIIGHNLMVQLGLVASFNCNVLEWYNTVVPIKDKVNISSNPNNISVIYKSHIIQRTTQTHNSNNWFDLSVSSYFETPQKIF